MWHNKFELPDELQSVSDIENNIKYITKTHEAMTDNSLMRIFLNKLEKRVISKVKTEYYLVVLTPETMKFLGSTKSTITKERN